METPQLQPQGPIRSEKWDPREGRLVVETSEVLQKGLKDVVIQMTSGRIVVEGAQIETPTIVTRLYVGAGTEADAKKYVQERKGVLEVQKGKGSIAVDARSQEGVAFGGGSNIVIGGGGSVVIGGDIVGGAVIGGGEVWINGRRVNASRGGSTIPSIQREVVLSVPQQDRLNYTLETQSGAVEIRKTGGECRVTTMAAGIEVSDYEGEMSLTNRSGDVEIERFKGELVLNATSGDVRISELDGTTNLMATSGDIKINRAQFKGRSNNIRATSGDISVGVSNDSLAVSAETASGKIRTPSTGDFIITREDRPKAGSGQFGRGTVVITSGSSIVSIGGSGGRSIVEGRFGQNERPENRLNVNATSGDVSISKG